MKNSCETVLHMDSNKESEFPNPEKCLLWKLTLKRKDAFGDSESTLKLARKNQYEASEGLLTLRIKNKEKLSERELLRSKLAALLFKSQTASQRISKINLKHKRTYDMIEEENKRGKENEKRLVQELRELRLNLSSDDNILENWQKDNTERDDAIRNLQDDMKGGLTVQAENEILPDTTNAESATNESEREQSVKERTSEENVDSKKLKPDKNDEKRKAVRRDWLMKKVLFDVAEKLKEHWMDIYMLINKRMQDLSIEVVNVREWRIDVEVQKRELLTRTEELEKLVSQKRRKKPVPPREHIDELHIWIKVQREVIETLRKIESKCLSIKVEDSEMYSEFAEAVRDMYVDTLKKQLSLELEDDNQVSEQQTEEAENQGKDQGK